MIQGTDLYNNLGVAFGIASAAVSASGQGATLDLQTLTAYGIIALIQISAASAADASNYITFSFEEGDASNLSDAAAPEANRVTGAIVQNVVTPVSVVKKMGLTVGTKRYARMKWVVTGTVGVTFAQLYLYAPRELPV